MLVTDKLRSHGVAHRELMSSADHRSHKDLNNRAENSHQPTRQRERATKGFRTVGRTQKFLSASSQTSPHFRPRRHRMTATGHRTETRHRFGTRNEITGTTATPTEA
ncbi:transposase-like protein [Streptomyces sp. TE3672]